MTGAPKQTVSLSAPKSFAIIPAAGRSRRMGNRNKLLLPWKSSTIIEQVLSNWLDSEVDTVVLVCRPDDFRLRELVRRYPEVHLVIPEEAPRDMKMSVFLGLRYLQTETSADQKPDNQDRWLVAPADMPTLAPALINQVIQTGRRVPLSVVPILAGRRGHPVSFPWSLSGQVAKLAENEGINRFLDQYPVHWLDMQAAGFPETGFPEDIDTEDDYRRILGSGSE